MTRHEGITAALASASGLRPASAFVAIAVVLLAVSARAAHIAFVAGGEQPRAVRESTAPRPAFEIADREGRPLAVSVECFDLTVSPRAMWRSHTPARMAGRLAELLGDDPAELLQRMLPPPDALTPAGLVRVREPRLVRFDGEGARQVDAWLQSGALDGAPGAGRIEGIWLAELGGGAWTLEWEPATALSEGARARHLGRELAARPDVWTRRLLDDLARLVDRPLPAELDPGSRAGLDSAGGREALRDALWAELLPCSFRVVRRRLDPLTAHALAELLRREAVSPWQMQLTPVLERRHPVRPCDPAGADGDEGAHPGDAFAVLGRWGVLGPEAALARARAERDADPGALEWFAADDPVERRAWELQTEWHARDGLELFCATALADPLWGRYLEEGATRYERRVRQVARDRRQRWRDRRVPNYFQGARDGADVPLFECTLDGPLQHVVHGELLRLVDEFRAAVAEAIVVDVASGDVLAVDGVYAYPMSGFAPLRHAFTPGSTMKAVVMAIALDAGVVRADEPFPTHSPDGIVLGNGARRIHEALGAPEEATITAEQGLAQSVNAVLVQIGMRVPATRLREKLVELGYGRRPGTGLGPEAAGHVPPLWRGTWRPIWEHASVSFGHELSASLWQHATALATIARGGVWRPLRVVRAVEQGDRRFELTVEPGTRVLSEHACRTVREMMATGAREGTGRDVASPEHCPELSYVGTKTGTTEKVPSEVSLHVEWPRQLELSAAGRPWTRAEYRALIGARDNLGLRNTCYTSSMCAVGAVPLADGTERELLVLVVVDEPRARRKFGADVAGPAAVAILRRALGLPPVAGAPQAAPEAPGAGAFADLDLPWAEEAACDWAR